MSHEPFAAADLRTNRAMAVGEVGGESRLNGRKGSTNPVNLVWRVRCAHAASEQAASVRRGRRQDHIDVDTLIKESVPEGDRLVLLAEPSCDNRTGFWTQPESQSLQLVVQPPRVIPE